MNRLLPLFALVAACRGSGDTGTDSGVEPTPTPTATDATFIPNAFGVKEARLALQPDGQIGPTADGTWSITVELVSESGDTCQAVFEGTTPAPQATFSGAGVSNVSVRALRPEGAPTGSCGSADLPEAWGDPLAALDAWAFGVGVTGAPDPDILDKLSEDDREALEPYLFGGGVYLAGVDGDGDGSPDQEPWRHVAIAWSEDDDGNLVPYDERVRAGELLPGTYVVLPQQYFTPARALLRPPN
mgnify:CR=1 FL=1